MANSDALEHKIQLLQRQLAASETRTNDYKREIERLGNIVTGENVVIMLH